MVIKELPYRPKLFKGYTMKDWYLNLEDEDDDSTDDTGNTDSGDSGDTGDSGETGGDDSGDSGETGGDDSGDTEEGSTFSETYDTEAEATAVAALEAAIADDTTTSTFDEVVDDETEVLGEYLGCYEVTAETGVLTLASPVEVTDPEVYTAIVLHYNSETETWEQVSDVQIIDGYVYAVFTSLSPIAVYTVKKKYAATVTIGEEVTNYETIAEAVNFAEANLASNPTVTLTWNKSITETIGPLYSTSDGTVTFDLAGYTIYADVTDGYAINISGDACTTNVTVTNGSIVASENTIGTIYAQNVYAAITYLDLTNCYNGGSNVVFDSMKASPADCNITSTNGTCIEALTSTSAFTSVVNRCVLTQTQTNELTGDEHNACVYLSNGGAVATVNLNIDNTLTSDVYGIYNGSASGKIYCSQNSGNSTVTAPTAIYIDGVHAAENGLYTSAEVGPTFTGAIVTNDTTETQGFAIKGGTYSVALDPAWIYEGYEANDNGDGTYTVVTSKIVECTTADGTITYKNTLSSSAVSAAGTGGTLKLLQDVTITGLTVSYDTTIDFNGHTATITGGSGIYAGSKDIECTIKNGYITSTSATSGAVCINASRGTFNVIDMYITGLEDSIPLAVGNKSKDYAATMNISGDTTVIGGTCAFTENCSTNTNIATLNISGNVNFVGSHYAVSGNGTYDGSTINIESGTFTCTGDGAAVYLPQKNTTTISGGTFMAVNSGIQICDGDVTISGVTVEVTGTDQSASKTGDGNIPDAAAVSIINRSGYSDTYPTLTITSGTFKSTNGKAVKAYAWANNTESTWDATDYVNISGGYYSDIVDGSYLAADCECGTEANSDGLYTVQYTTVETE